MEWKLVGEDANRSLVALRREFLERAKKKKDYCGEWRSEEVNVLILVSLVSKYKIAKWTNNGIPRQK